MSANEYQYNCSDFVWKYCHKNKPLLRVKKKMVIPAKALLISVVPWLIKKGGMTSRKATNVRNITKAMMKV